MGEFINTIDVLGDDAVIDSLIEKTIPEFRDNRVEKVGQYAFYGCKALVLVDLPRLKTIADNAFEGCTALTALILRSRDRVASLGNANAIPANAIVYVPRSMVAAYRAASNWSSLAEGRVLPVEDYPDITGG